MRVPLIASLLFSAAVVGCTLIVSLDEHRLAVDGGAPPLDAALDAAGPLDGEVDAALDAAPDAAQPDAGPFVPTRGCADRATSSFCDDFDDGGGLGNWFSLPGAGTIAISDGGLSPANAVFVSVPSAQDGGRETAKINRIFAPTARTVRIAVNLRDLADKAEVTLLAINLGNGHFVGLRAFGSQSGVTMFVDVESTSSTQLSPLLSRSWHDIGLQLTYPDGGSSGALITSLDGAKRSVALPYPAINFTVELGLIVSERAGATVAIDDVTVD